MQPPSRRNEVLGWVKEGVRDFSISRSNVDWGIRMPQDAEHTVYVWFDALNGSPRGLCVCVGVLVCVRAKEAGLGCRRCLCTQLDVDVAYDPQLTLGYNNFTPTR